ncbi:hypothetical protein JF535_01120 [Microbulbifer salipaludis]|uniref:Uncharacterized protein n=1 Tax=Microbulbifer salipaludis TaxID=187980 RepID=A0ABS3E2B1_9GAMM|nr:hypothetical protein [Microbulbifer salipaludis]MBN8429439.1 hypothetical protein [Microbulbifer salipaludis]
MSLFTALCLTGLAISLWLTLRQRNAPLLRRAGAALLQSVIWLLVWSLLQPPSVLPPTEPFATADAPKMAADGLSRDALRDLPPVRLQSLAAGPSPAWQMAWSRTVTLGEPLVLSIALQDGEQHPVTLTLQDPFGHDVDSAPLSADHPRATLRAQPKMAGNWLYRLRIESSSEDPASAGKVGIHSESGRSELLPVTVREAQNPRVLLWLSRPGFETAALARWLRQSGTPAQVVTQLAPGMQRRETFNGQPLHDAELLGADSPFDLLVLDSRLWSQLNAAQQRRLTRLHASKSLLWLVDSDSPAEFVDYARAQKMPLRATKPVTASYTAFITSRPAASSPARDAKPTPPPLQLAAFQPAAILDRDMLITEDGNTLYWARVEPRQSLGFVFFRNSYQWQTAGFAQVFAQLWKQLVDRQLTYQGSDTPIHVRTILPRALQRLTLCSGGFGDTPLPLRSTQSTSDAGWGRGVPAGADAHGRCYSYWPPAPGWYQLGDTDFSVYVSAADTWREWQAGMTRQESAQMARARLGPETESQSVRQPIPLPWLALALLALLTLTWWRERSSLR